MRLKLIAAMTLMALASTPPPAGAQSATATEHPMEVAGTQLIDCKITKSMTFIQSPRTDHADAGSAIPKIIEAPATVTVTCERSVAFSVVSGYIDSLKRSGSPNR